MNRWLVSISTAAVAGLAMAATNVESSNIVGYTEVEAKYRANLLAINYTTPDGSALSIQDAFPYVEGMTDGHQYTAADQLQIPDPQTGGYTTYYISDGYNALGKAYSADRYHKWCKAGTIVATTDTIPTGTGFWFVRKSIDAPVTNKVAGGVSLIGSYDKVLTGAARMVANPYPEAMPLNDCIPFVDGMTDGHQYTAADQLQIWSPETGGYTTYYMSDGYNALGKAYSAARYHKWCKAGTIVPTEDVLPVGTGAWYIRKGANNVELSLVRPFNVE